MKLHVGQGLLVLEHAGVKHGSGPIGFLQGCPLGQRSHETRGDALPSQKEGGPRPKKKKKADREEKEVCGRRKEDVLERSKKKTKRVDMLDNVI